MKWIAFFVMGIFLASCQDALESLFDSKEEQGVELVYTPRASSSQDPRVRVQHILIAFNGSIPKEISRSKKQAKDLAFELKTKIKEDPSLFNQLASQYSDAATPGVYAISNFGVEPKPGETRRGEWHDGFGAAAFALNEGQIYVLEYDETRAPFGYHVMMRLPY